MKRQSQITELTKKNLIDSFFDLYKRVDINKITIKSICDNANYDRTTFYRYFDNVADILKVLEDEIICQMRERVNNSSYNTDTTNIISCDNFRRFNNDYGEYIMIFYKNGNYSFCNKFKNLIKSDVFKYFDFNIVDNNKKEFIFEFVFSSLISSYIYWYNHDDMIDIDSFVSFANNVIFDGTKNILNNI